mgnify:CR=1 FL=1
MKVDPERLLDRFKAMYGKQPVVYRAPGRGNIIGEHTDYNDGYVLPMAIDRYVVMAGGLAPGDVFRSCSMDLDELQFFRSNDPEGKKNGDWSNYLRGVVDGCRAEGLWPGPMNIMLQSEVPVGGGLSSSAAIEVATATLIEAASRKKLDVKRKALIAQQAEHDYAGVPCGIMDQFASALCGEGQLMLLDCRSEEPLMVPFTDPDIAVLIINSNVKHELTGGEYAERRGQCEQVAAHLGIKALRDADMGRLDANRGDLDEVLYRRARHVVTENARTLEAAEAFSAGRWSRVGELMAASHASLRDDFEVSCPELDVLVELALGLGQGNGVYGSRMTGGGFGGCTVSLVDRNAVDAVAETIRQEYREKTGIEPAFHLSGPARGAHVLVGEGDE